MIHGGFAETEAELREAKQNRIDFLEAIERHKHEVINKKLSYILKGLIEALKEHDKKQDILNSLSDENKMYLQMAGVAEFKKPEKGEKSKLI